MKNLAIIFLFILNGSELIAQDMSDEYMNAYIVVSDTSEEYYKLRDKMFELCLVLESEIDTMGRGFDQLKNLICLPENDEDEIYAGDYFPRRYPTETLSLEYLSYYSNEQNANPNTIALVTLITDDIDKADKKLAKIKKYSPSAFVLNSMIYMGCMH